MHCIDVLFIDFDTTSSVNDKIIERFNKVIDLNVMLLQTRILNSEISQIKQMIHAWLMTSSRSRILNWLHWSRNENSWRASEFHDCEYARITFRWNWNSVCKACKSSERLVDLMRSSSISISRRMYIAENSNFLMKHVVKRLLKMSLLKFYWSVSTR